MNPFLLFIYYYLFIFCVNCEFILYIMFILLYVPSKIFCGKGICYVNVCLIYVFQFEFIL
jgi:hypothetical protein